MPVASLVLHMIARGALVLGRICRFPAVRSSEGGVSAVMRPHRLMDCRWIGASPVLPCSEGGVGGYVATVRSM